MRPGGVALLLLAACVREPLAGVCPDVGAGELAIHELAAGWLELKNTGDRPLELAERRLDGSDAVDVLLREETWLDPGGFLVVPAAVYPGGVLDVWACAEQVDRASWRDLPSPASLGRRGDSFCLVAASPGAENPSCE
jgi:hypothetical protein